jgi:hypothetical protein
VSNWFVPGVFERRHESCFTRDSYPGSRLSSEPGRLLTDRALRRRSFPARCAGCRPKSNFFSYLNSSAAERIKGKTS